MYLLKLLVELLASVPSPVATVILAMVPIGELRGALPVALLVYHLPIWLAVVLSLLGNMLPVYFLLVFFESVSNWLRMRSRVADRFFTYLFERTRHKLERNIVRYGPWALALFVAIPLPVTGAWTGSLAAFVFGLDKRKAFLSIALGAVIASVVVTVLTLGISATVRSLL